MTKRILTFYLLIFTNVAYAAPDPVNIQKVVDLARSQGITQCDQLITQVFADIGPGELKVQASDINGRQRQSVRLTAVYGNVGDSVIKDAVVQYEAGQCYAYVSSSFILNQSCESLMAEYTAFKMFDKTADTFWTKNEGDILLLLMPGNNTCMLNFSANFKG